MKVVYVITSAGRDVYTAMTRVSAASLRMTNPGATITVACDVETDLAVRATKDPLLGEVDEWLAFETPPGNAAFRNRFLKTSLRERISGEYLFLDSDTIVRDDLAPIDRQPGDLAAAPNHSRENISGQIWEGDVATLAEMQWTTSRVLYVNGGVMRVSESEGAHRFYRLWHEKWQASYRRIHKPNDQPALNAAIHESGIECARLPVRYNSQIGAYPVTMRDAAIWHYNSSLAWQNYSHIDERIQQAVRSDSVDIVQLRNLMESQVLWTRSFWFVGAGAHMINGSVRDLMAAVESGQDAAAFFRAMQMVDSVYARRVLAKTMADAYWGNTPKAYRFARAMLWRRYPCEMAREPVRGCLLHDLRRRIKALGAGPKSRS